MAGADEWADALPVDTNGDVHVASRSDGVYVFYTEEPEAFVRTDHVVDLAEHR